MIMQENLLPDYSAFIEGGKMDFKISLNVGKLISDQFFLSLLLCLQNYQNVDDFFRRN